MARAVLILSLLLLFGAPPAVAQDRPAPEHERQDGARRGAAWTDQALEVLTRELDLDTAQRERIRTILDEVTRDAFARVGEYFRGGLDEAAQAKARAVFDEIRVELARRISGELTPAQREEFEVLVDQFDRRAQRFEDSRRAQERPAELFNPAPASKRILLAKAERMLFLGPDELAVVLPYVQRVIDARHALYEGRRVRRADLLNAAEAGATKEELEERLAEIRAAEQFQHLELVAAQHTLRELLTVDQEARFVALGLLD